MVELCSAIKVVSPIFDQFFSLFSYYFCGAGFFKSCRHCPSLEATLLSKN
jgi:hypothetical protein